MENEKIRQMVDSILTSLVSFDLDSQNMVIKLVREDIQRKRLKKAEEMENGIRELNHAIEDLK
jgi:predicted RND superfamily exporter protein